MADFTLVIKAIDQASAALKGVERSLGNLSTKADQVNKAVNNSLGGIVSASNKVAVGFVAMATASSFYAKSVSDASKVTDVSIQTILGFGQALQANGGLASKAGDAIDKFSENLGSAKQGSFDTQYAFSKLGVTFQDLNNLSNEDIFKKTIQGLGNITDKAQQAALKQQFFGKTLDGVNASGVAADLDQYTISQLRNVDAVKSAEQTVGLLKEAYTKLELAIIRAIKPVADFVNKASPQQIDAFISAITTLGAGMLALSVSMKIFTAIGSAIGAVAGYIALFGTGFAMVTKTVTIFTAQMGYAWKAISGATGVMATLGEIGTTVWVLLTKRVWYLLGGLARMIPLVGTILTVVWALNEAIKAAFDFNPIDWFLEKLDKAYEGFKAFLGLKSGNAPAGQADVRKIDNALDKQSGAGAGGGGKALNAAVEAINKNMAQLISTYTGLGGKMAGVDTNMARQAMTFEELSGAAEKLGVVLQKPTKLIERDFNIAVAKSAEEVRRLEIQYGQTANILKEYEIELKKSSIEIMKQEVILGNDALMQEKWMQELQKSSQALSERSAKLGNAEIQQIAFSQSIRESLISTMEQESRIAMLNKAYDEGRISLRIYGDELGKLDQRLLNSSQIAQQVISQGVDEAQSYQTRLSALGEVTKAYEEGKISIEAYTAAFEKLNLTYSATPLSIVLDKSKKLAGQYDENSKNADELRKRVAEGTLTWKEYEAAVAAIGQEHFPEYARQLRELTPMSVEFAKVVQESATKMSDSFTESFYQVLKEGKFTFSAFKDMVTGILDDIAKLVIRKAFADPIASGIAGIITGMQQGGASAGGGFGGIFSSIGGALGKFFGGGSAASTGTGLEGMSAETLALAGLADGGIVTKPTLAMIGEGGGPEAVIPLSMGNQGKYGLSQGASDSAPVVNFTLNAVDTQTGVEFLLKNKPAIIKVVQDAYDTRGRRGPVNS